MIYMLQFIIHAGTSQSGKNDSDSERQINDNKKFQLLGYLYEIQCGAVIMQPIFTKNHLSIHYRVWNEIT